MKGKTILKMVLIPSLLLLFLFGFTMLEAFGTSEEATQPVTDQFEIVRKTIDNYLTAITPQVITAEKLYQEAFENQNKDFLLVDVRASGDFLNGNIRGSISIPYGDTANPKKLKNLPADKTLIVIDYNGHWAAQTAAGWNMLGFNAIPLQYGIQSWTNDLAAADYDSLPEGALQCPLVSESEGKEGILANNLPELKIPAKTDHELIQLLTATYLDRNYRGYIDAQDVCADLRGASPEDSFIIDTRTPEHYALGHIRDSVNIGLNELAKTDVLKLLPRNKKLIIVGYDGMDASFGVRALVTMGYNAVALKYGLSFWNDELVPSNTLPIPEQIPEYFELTPLNYLPPSTGPAGCG